jgi:hypothetical protein
MLKFPKLRGFRMTQRGLDEDNGDMVVKWPVLGVAKRFNGV